MIDQYFKDYCVKEEFSKEFITLWNGWLGKKNLHKLNEVTQAEWQRFNDLLLELFNRYELFSVNINENICSKVKNPEEIIDSYKVSLNKPYTQFTKIIIPELDAVYSEEWDYTWILWYKNKRALEAFEPLIRKCKLYNFSDNKF